MRARRFEDLVAWQLCHELQAAVIALIARPQVARDRGFCDQMLEASRSATSNVAEGFRRYSHGQFGQFLDISLASQAEVQSLLKEARLRRFVTGDEFGAVWQLSRRAEQVTLALRRSLRLREAPPPRPLRRSAHGPPPPHPRTTDRTRPDKKPGSHDEPRTRTDEQ